MSFHDDDFSPTPLRKRVLIFGRNQGEGRNVYVVKKFPLSIFFD